MKFQLKKYCFSLLSVILFLNCLSQYEYKKKGDKWYCLKNGKEIIPPLYDTILPFEPVKGICMACVKSQKGSNNKFIKTNNMVFMCKYLNEENTALVINIGKDTTAFFQYGKTCYDSYKNHPQYFSVTKNDKKYLIDKSFKQITKKGYDDVYPAEIPSYLYIKKMTTGMSYLEGVINLNEEVIIEPEYTSVKSNPFDSLFFGCTAQLKLMGEDDIFDINGKKLKSVSRHIEYATKHFIIHKVFEPREYYIVYNPTNKKEKSFFADNISYLGNEMVEIKIKKQIHRCNLFQLDEYKFLNYE